MDHPPSPILSRSRSVQNHALFLPKIHESLLTVTTGSKTGTSPLLSNNTFNEIQNCIEIAKYADTQFTQISNTAQKKIEDQNSIQENPKKSKHEKPARKSSFSSKPNSGVVKSGFRIETKKQNLNKSTPSLKPSADRKLKVSPSEPKCLKPNIDILKEMTDDSSVSGPKHSRFQSLKKTFVKNKSFDDYRHEVTVSNSLKSDQSFGFRTAGGKSLSIKNLDRVNNIFKDLEEETNIRVADLGVSPTEIKSENQQRNNGNQSNNQTFGFRTAGGKSLSIKNLDKVQNIFKDIENEDPKNIKTDSSLGNKQIDRRSVTGNMVKSKLVRTEPLSSQQQSTEKDSSEMFGFQTAGGKRLNIKNIEKYRNIFKDLETEDSEPPNKIMNNLESQSRDKEIAIETDIKDSNIFFDCESDNNIDQTNTPGFRTAGGKSLKVQNLDKVNHIFKHLDADVPVEHKIISKKSNEFQNSAINERLAEKNNVNEIEFGESSKQGLKPEEEFLLDSTLDSKMSELVENIIMGPRYGLATSTPKSQTPSSTPSHSLLKKVIKPSDQALKRAASLFEDILTTTPIRSTSEHTAKKLKFENRSKPDPFNDITDSEMLQAIVDDDSDRTISELYLQERREIDKKMKTIDKIDFNGFEKQSIHNCLKYLKEEIEKLKAETKKQSRRALFGISKNTMTPVNSVNESVQTGIPNRKCFSETSVRELDVSDQSFRVCDNVFGFRTPSSKSFIEKLDPVDSVDVYQFNSNTSCSQRFIQDLDTSDFASTSHSKFVKGSEEFVELHVPRKSVGLVGRKEELNKNIDDLETLLETMKEKKKAVETQILMQNSKNTRFKPGELYITKTYNKSRCQKLIDFVEGQLPLTYIDFHKKKPPLWNITSENAKEVHFYLPSPPHPAALTLTEGSILVPTTSHLAGINEFKMTLECFPHVDKTKISCGWFENHYKWIIWKLVSLDRQFLNNYRFLTPNNVILQLRYRYDRDIHNNERSAFRKIAEKDDTSTRRMVVCVSKILRSDGQVTELEVTDGWYGIQAVFDLALLKYVNSEKIVVGTKLITFGAEMKNHEGACHPLELPKTAYLKLHCNSTRRAKWDTKLGFQRNPQPFLSNLETLNQDGGQVGLLSVYVARVFPLKYLEKIEENKWTCRCERAENRVQAQWQVADDALVEKAHHEASKQLQAEWADQCHNKSTVTETSIKELSCSALASLIEFSDDPGGIFELMDRSQYQEVEKYKTRLNFERELEFANRMQDILASYTRTKRNVSLVLNAIVVDAANPDPECFYHLEIWNPDESILEVIQEDTRLRLYNVLASCSWDQRLLKGTSKSQFLRISQEKCNENWKSFRRLYSPIKDMQLLNYKPLFNYCDTIGIIIKICLNDTFKCVWLADPDTRLLRVQYRMDPTNCLPFEGFHPGDLVAVFNLRFVKPLNGQAQARVDYCTTVTKNPVKDYVLVHFRKILKELPLSMNDFIADLNDKIEEWHSEVQGS